MRVIINVIPNDQQRYCTVGDWVWDGDSLTILVSKMGNWRYEMLVAFHELAEALICRHREIPEEIVSAFDIEYERNRAVDDTDSEPGDDPHAPYYREHQFATNVERQLALELDVNWNQYDDTVNNL